MRPGLVAVGVGFLVLAGGALVTVNLLPASAGPEQNTFALAPTDVPAHGSGWTEIAGADSAAGTLTVRWSTDAPLHLAMYPASDCPTGGASCASGAGVAGWNGTGAGNWSISGPQQFPYDLVWSSTRSTAGNLTANAVETYPGTSTTSTWSVLLIDAVAITLGVVGGVALFLGLFLRGGIYRGPAPLVSRSADDAEEIGRAPPSG